MAQSLSMVAMFDDIVRSVNLIVDDGGIEEAFLEFALNQEECRLKWNSAELESRRLVAALAQSERNVSELEGRLHHARRLLDQEKKKKKEVEMDRDTLEKQLGMVRSLVFFGNEGNKLNDETREKLAFLNNSTMRERRSGRPSGDRLNTINESLRTARFNDTASILSDLSYSRSEDDLDVSVLQSGKQFRKYQPSGDLGAPLAKKRKSITGSLANGNERLVATTTVTVHRDGPVKAQSKIETMQEKTPQLYKHQKATAPPPPMPRTTSDSDSEPPLATLWAPKTPQYDKTPRCDQRYTPYAYTPGSSTTMLRQTGGKMSRSHAFVNKTVIRPEYCGPCGKRIRFGKVALKCRDCRSSCHTDCRELLPLPCVPTYNTPTRAVVGASVIADFAPPVAPMVPALVVHCINEIENRGMKEVGLYRVPGAETEVRGLREAFLKNRGTPHLANIDVHTLCGTVKDFLRAFREPLIPTALWHAFVSAADKTDEMDAQAAIYQAMAQLPQPNRDTLAFLVLHLQKISECADCKMPASNLAKVFGPTVVGYSSPEPLPNEIMLETTKQADVMRLLLGIDSDYYRSFAEAAGSSTEGSAAPAAAGQAAPPPTPTRTNSYKGFFNTPGGSRTYRNKGQKFFNTPTQADIK